ncbi:hypothetical protein, partial [Bifidobacterium saguinibicoloris]|uniref:hypothetical protein n=1 Tax=Bifidobacterium saguinibicoloris TaxID=2834433 RepID=UPI001C567134
ITSAAQHSYCTYNSTARRRCSLVYLATMGSSRITVQENGTTSNGPPQLEIHPTSLIRPEHWWPLVSGHARDKDGDDSPKPYDDGIQTNNHDDPANEPGFYIRKGHVR